MNLHSRVERLERHTGAGVTCPVCDSPAPTKGTPSYDESTWTVGDALAMNFACLHCGWPRLIIVELIKRRDEAA